MQDLLPTIAHYCDYVTTMSVLLQNYELSRLITDETFWRANNKTQIIPDYYCIETYKWVVFPHEVEDMTIDEITQTKGDRIASLFM